MSYAKAMKHSRNVRKSRKQGKMYFGFDTGTGNFKENPALREITLLRMDVNRWFSERHNGDKQYIRECIREAIQELRSKTQAYFQGTQNG